MSVPEGDELASAEQIREIADAAHDILLEATQEEWDDPEHAATKRLPLAYDALRFCARAAQELGDPGLFETIADPFVLRVLLERDFPEDDADVLGEATADLLSRMPRLGERAIALASDSSPEIRRAIARGLRPAVPGALALLRKLIADVDPQVRAAAKESIGDAVEAPWWTGFLSADPASIVGERAAVKARPVLEKILENLSVAEHARGSTFPEIVKLAKRLPRSLAATAAERALLLVDYRTKECIAPLAGVVLAGPDAEAALDRLAAAWCENGRPLAQEEPVAQAIAALPAKRAAEHCRRLARLALAAPEEERFTDGSVSDFRAELAGHAWPRSLDYGLVLDAIDAIEPEEGIEHAEGALDSTITSLGKVFDKAPPRAAHVPRLVERFTRPPSRSWRDLGHWIGTHLAKLPARALRPVAERAAASAEERVVRWGLEMLASKARVKSDPPPREMLRAWVGDPRLRPSVAASLDLRELALPWLRLRLVAGELDFDAAVETILCAEASRPFMQGKTPEGSKRVAASPDEWAAYRAVRDAARIEDSHDWCFALHAVPPGPRQPADRAFFARAIEAARQDRDVVFWLRNVLRGAEGEGALAEATALLAIAQGDDRDDVREIQGEIAKALGVEPPADPVEVAAAARAEVAPVRAREWMDEPEE